MSKNNKVIWSEGMFLRPQHFQQQNRYLESRIESRCQPLRPYSWGLTKLSIDQQLLALGKFALTEASGIFPDGTPFNMPDEDPLPPALEVDTSLKNETIYLSLPGVPENGTEVGESNTGTERYLLTEIDSRDTHSFTSSGAAAIEAGTLNSSLRLNRQDLGAYTSIPIAKIIERHADSRVTLDEKTIPASLTCSASSRLIDYVEDIHGLLHHRAETLADRLGSPGAGGVAEVADFLLLQIVNRYDALFQHLATLSSLHPESLFRIFLEIAGELATITNTNRRPNELPQYQHEDLNSSFQPLILEIRQSLNWDIIDRNVSIPLKVHKQGVRSADISDPELLKSASFILAVNAEISSEKLRREFPHQTTIGTKENLRDLVISRTSGIELSPLAVAPRQIPFHAGFTYFELEKQGKIWKELEKSGAMAMHISVDFPGIELEFWAIRG